MRKGGCLHSWKIPGMLQGRESLCSQWHFVGVVLLVLVVLKGGNKCKIIRFNCIFQMEVNCLTLKDLISPRQSRLDFAIEDAETAQKVSTNTFIVSNVFWFVMPSFYLDYSIITMTVIEEYIENGAITTIVGTRS